MTTRVHTCCAVGLLAVVLLLPGCKKPGGTSTNTTPAQQQAGNNGGNGGNGGFQGAGPGVMGTLPAVGRIVTLNELEQLGKWYMTYPEPPAGPEVLKQDQGMAKIYAAYQEGDLVVYWGANPARAPNGASNTVLAYSKGSLAKGGPIPVAMLDGTARTMSKQEFESAAKAGK